MFTLLTLMVYAINTINGELVGPITIKEDGKNVTRYIVSTDPAGINVYGSTVVLMHNTNIQIAKNNSNTYTTDTFMEYKLKGKTLSFTANISTVSCSCNAAFYLVTMPGYGSDGKPKPGNGGNYACGANDANDFCWELDIMEANKYVTQATPHNCSAPPGTYITSCDGPGCSTNSYNVDSKGMCPNESCKINTMKPFRQSMTFGSTIHIVMRQDGNQFEFDACSNSQYVQLMNQALDYGMTIVISYWGSDYSRMQWLDGKTGCTGDCDITGLTIFSDIEIS